MGRMPNWSPEELEYLEEKWGVISIKAISKNLGRSIEAVKLKAQRIGLGDNRKNVDGITVNQLSLALNTSYSILKTWIKKHGFPAKKKVFAQTNRVLIVKYEDFWEWAEQHKNLINLSRLEPNILGPEPDWAKEKRKLDILNFNKILERPWSEKDDATLKSMVNAYRYTYPQIAKVLKRTEGAVKRRLYDLNIKARPLRLNNHIKWTDEEVYQLMEMFHKGYGYNTMAEKLDKSELSIRGKLERMGYKFRFNGGMKPCCQTLLQN